MPFRKALVAAGALLVAFSLARPVHAQFASSIEGTVSDPSQAVVPGAAVTISNEATGVTQNVRTTSAGYYRFPALAGGTYTVKVSLQGFKDPDASRQRHPRGWQLGVRAGHGHW
ncbi:MAG: carboxypeptidase regulatory-like domain-containing protein [Chloroflexi bacterium]|nr:MAG: carboxypeptidase regulatory-like domain-containing protein [Chloroflexota bacterium]